MPNRSPFLLPVLKEGRLLHMTDCFLSARLQGLLRLQALDQIPERNTWTVLARYEPLLMAVLVFHIFFVHGNNTLQQSFGEEFLSMKSPCFYQKSTTVGLWRTVCLPSFSKNTEEVHKSRI